jgi:hypothetical protein
MIDPSRGSSDRPLASGEQLHPLKLLERHRQRRTLDAEPLVSEHGPHPQGAIAMQTSESTHDAGPAARAGATLEDFFGGGAVDLPGLALHLDGLTDAARAAATVAMTPRQQARLYEAAQGFHALTLEHFVPAGVAPLTQVIHTGKNSIPLVSRFEKRFCLPAPGSDRLWGYNENPLPIRAATGPGYFVCLAIDAGQVLIDYGQVPTDKPPGRPDGWPAVRPNSAGLSRFIYHRTKDTMRGVSNHLSIGRAARDGKAMDNWFVLCRRG